MRILHHVVSPIRVKLHKIDGHSEVVVALLLQVREIRDSATISEMYPRVCRGFIVAVRINTRMPQNKLRKRHCTPLNFISKSPTIVTLSFQAV